MLKLQHGSRNSSFSLWVTLPSSFFLFSYWYFQVGKVHTNHSIALFFSFNLRRMEGVQVKGKKSLIMKTWKRCLSLGARRSNENPPCDSLSKSKSWNRATSSSPLSSPEKEKTRAQVAPEGCFTVYVGAEKQRFVIKTEFANHPLFKILLEDAESEYGFNSQGPILLPCDVELFYKVLAEMEESGGDPAGFGFGKGYSPFLPFSPSHRPNFNINKGYGAYRLLSPSRILKINGF